MNRTHRRGGLLCAALVLAGALAGCSRAGGEDAGGPPADSGGLSQVASPPPSILSPDLVIGSAEGRHGTAALGAPIALEVDSLGRIYVLDALAKQVRVFSPMGDPVRAFGREGAAPGEFRQPIGLAWGPGPRLWVVDAGLNRYNEFDGDGTYLRSVPRSGGLTAIPWPGRFDRLGRLYDILPSGGENNGVAVIRWSPEFDRSEILKLPAFERQSFSNVSGDGRIETSAAVPFSPALVWGLDLDGRLWSGTSDRYRLSLSQFGGGAVRRIEQRAAAVRVSAAEQRAAIDGLRWFTDQGGRVRESDVPKTKPFFAAVLVDDENNLWVRVPASEKGVTEFDVFGPASNRLYRVALPFHLNEAMPMVVRAGRVYVGRIDDDNTGSVIRLHFPASPGQSQASRKERS